MVMNYFAFDTEFSFQADGSLQFLAIAVSWSQYAPAVVFSALPLAECMAPHEVAHAVFVMYSMFKARAVPVTWSGTNSDFRLLHNFFVRHGLFGHAAMCTEMVMHHVDLAFLMLCDRGHMVGLDAVTHQTLGVEKPIKSSNVDKLWRMDRGKILELVLHDATMTRCLFEYAFQHKVLRWANQSGRVFTWRVPVHKSAANMQYIKTVRQGLLLPHPRKKWKKAITRDSCLDWVSPIMR